MLVRETRAAMTPLPTISAGRIITELHYRNTDAGRSEPGDGFMKSYEIPNMSGKGEAGSPGRQGLS